MASAGQGGIGKGRHRATSERSSATYVGWAQRSMMAWRVDMVIV